MDGFRVCKPWLRTNRDNY